MTTPTSHDDSRDPTLRGEDCQSSYLAADDADTITPEKAQLIALGYAEIRDRLERHIAHSVNGGDLDGLTEEIHSARRFDALVELWNTYSDLAIDVAAIFQRHDVSAPS